MQPFRLVSGPAPPPLESTATLAPITKAPPETEYLTKVSRIRSLEMALGDESVPAFLLKLYTMLEEEEDSSISWSEEGETFVVSDPTEFATNVLPQYFKHNNFNSFVRQLNLYGFHKLKQAPKWHEFAHPLFKRGKKHLLKDIKRRTPGSRKQQAASSHIPHTTAPSSPFANPALHPISIAHPRTDGGSGASEPIIGWLERQNEQLSREVQSLSIEIKEVSRQQEKMRTQMQQMFDILTQVLSSEQLGARSALSLPQKFQTIHQLRHAVTTDSPLSHLNTPQFATPQFASPQFASPAADCSSSQIDSLLSTLSKRSPMRSIPQVLSKPPCYTHTLPSGPISGHPSFITQTPVNQSLLQPHYTQAPHPQQAPLVSEAPTVSETQTTMPALDPSLTLGWSEKDRNDEGSIDLIDGALEDFDSWQRINASSKNDQAEYWKLISDFEAQLSGPNGLIPDFPGELPDLAIEAGQS